ncbi:glutamate--tRNA ligase [Candidatus Woesearchaeota archaeon]|nr:glutamate--tRNA ligase [Candidatus Woesearchaeota archaeon]
MALPKDFEATMRKYALQNAAQFGGKANSGAVIGKILAENPALKPQIKDIAAAVSDVLKSVNRLSVEKQVEELARLAPELLEKKKAEKKDLPELKNAVMGQVVTRIPPEPSKYAHIGHALSFLINYMYAKKYNGKCFVRFEDTNPELSRKEFADAMLEDMKYLGIQPSKVAHISNDMPMLYDYAEKLIRQGNAFVCLCNQEKMRELRHEGFGCSCRSKDAKNNIGEWKSMLGKKYGAGDAVLRLKGDMQSPNHVMRDPVIFRISLAEHYLQGSKYCVWPLYDFANSVEDGVMGITHVMRSSEFGTMRIELQDKIKEMLKLPKQRVIQYGRFNVVGAVTQGRELRKLMEEGKVKSWDDPQLVTIKALRRRGIQPETYWELAIEVGLSPTETNFDWHLIAAVNRKILDPKCNRYFYVESPKQITVKGAQERKLELKLHPDLPDGGKRHFVAKDRFHVSKKDYDEVSKLKSGSLVRLMDCLNFQKPNGSFTFDSVEYERYRMNGSMIIQWLPADDPCLMNAKILMPDGSLSKGLAEAAAANIKVGEIVQFTRFGFCRLESRDEQAKELSFIYCHS